MGRRLIAALIIACLTNVPDSMARSHSNDQWGGCMLSASGSAKLQGQLYKSTGYPSLDANLNSSVDLLKRYFNVNPSYFMFDDRTSPNAFATPDVYQPGFEDGSVVLGNVLLVQEFQKSGALNFSLTGILAHETAHILQFKLGEHLPVKMAELEADYMAGWFVSQLSLLPNGNIWNGQAAQQNLYAFYNKGDYAFNTANHHGTPQERLSAVKAGLSQRDSSVEEAFQHAHTYVTGGRGDFDPPQTVKSPITHLGGEAESGDLCTALQGLIPLTRTKFRALRGQPDPDDPEIYSSKKTLPGARECEIVDGSFNCEFQESASKSDYDNLLSKVKRCVDWTFREKSSTDVTFDGPHDVGLQVVIDKRSTLNLWIHNYE